jgi:hypothetical protein
MVVESFCVHRSIRRNLKAFVNGGLLCCVGVSATVATCCDKE